tara:strand:- start:85 stop:513 length:429 start_codon:yes stop_codon:yes gene_type:complete
MPVPVIIATVLSLVSLYGFIKKCRFYFNLGYCLMGLLIASASVMDYLSGSESIALMTATVFVIQAILMFPNKINYDGSKIAKSAGIKIYTSVSLVNFIAVFLSELSPAPNITIWLHLVLAIMPLGVIYLMMAGKIKIKENES